jgi:serine/threonine-protein kinase
VRKFVARHRFPVAVAGIALVAVLATATMALFQAQRAALEARRATAERDRALTLSSRNEAVAEFLNVLLTEAASSEKPITVKGMIERSEALVDAEYPNDSDSRAAMLNMIASYYVDNGDTARAETLTRNALDSVRNSPDADLRREITCQHARLLAALGRVPEGTRILHAVVADPQATASQRTVCLAYLSYIAHDNADGAGAVKYANEAIASIRQDRHPSATFEAHLLTTLADAERLSGHNDLAGQYFERALARLARAGRQEGSVAIVIRNNWAVLSLATGNPAHTLKLQDEAAALVTRRQPGTPLPLYLIHNRALALEALGRYREALDAYSQCIARGTENGSATIHALCLSGQGSVFRELGDLSAAAASWQRGAEVARTNPVSVSAQRSLRILAGRIALSSGRLAAARAELDAALATVGPPAVKTPILVSRAELSLQEEKFAAAGADARQALANAQSAQGGVPYSWRTGAAWLMLGRALRAQGRQEPAREAFRNAVTHLSRTVDEQHPMLKLARQLANG